MKKLISRTLCLIFIVLLVLPAFTACGNKKVLELGKYSINEKEYTYLTGMYKKQILVSLENHPTFSQIGDTLTDEHLSLEISSGVTLGDYINYTYRASFEQSLLTLLYSQLLFDEYNLELTDEEEETINSIADQVVAYYGPDKIKEYGFDKQTLISVYEKQFKEQRVRQHILGASNEKITSDQIESYYFENYLRYKVIVINTLYTIHTDSEGRQSFVYLSSEEKEKQELLVTELKELLVNKNMDYSYILLKDDLDLSYDELWEKYSDDKSYPNGYYGSSSPSEEELQGSSELSAAYQSNVGEIKTVIAKRYFTGSGTIQGGDGVTTIKPGDYFEYGTVFVKRLALDSRPYESEEYKSLFGSLESSVANSVYLETITEHEKTSALTIDISSIGADITFDNVKANELDYYFLHGSSN